MNYSIRIIVDNNAPEDFVQEHGFAAWIEAGDRCILFDTGQGEALTANAAALGIDLSQADMIVLSHGHWDHTGALARALGEVGDIPVLCHPDAFLTRYSVKPADVAREISMAETARSALESLPQGRLEYISSSREIFPGVGITGEVPRRSDFEDTGGPFFLDSDRKEPDLLMDDLSLWIETEEGLVILTGCCHAGLVNTVEHIREVSGIDRVHALIGGLHLVNADSRRLGETCCALREWNPQLIVPCHCTGKGAVEFMVGEFGNMVREGHVGFDLSTN